MDGLSKALVQMPYVPKETVFLARMACELASPITEKDQALKRLLDDMAAAGREDAGLVDPTVDEIRAQLMKGKRATEIPTGSITTTEPGLEVEIEGKPRVFRIGSFGAVEQMETQGQGVFLSGWVADRELSEGAKAIHVFNRSQLVETFTPSGQRPEFELGDVLMGFHGYVPVVSSDAIFCFGGA